MRVIANRVQTRVLEGFDDPAFGAGRWEALLRRGNSDCVYLTWEWQRTWWEIHPRGDLLLVVAERGGEVVALAPFYAESGMIYFVGTGFESGYLDFIGDMGAPGVLQALLETAVARVRGFLGFDLYFVSDRSPTGQRLAEAAERLGLGYCDDDEIEDPLLDLAGQPAVARAACNKDSLVRKERFFRREGDLEVRHLRDGEAILAHLDAFFEQHITRWAVTSTASGFLKERSRTFIQRLTRAAARAGWLRFTRIDWRGRPVAFHYGFCYQGRYFWEIPTFAIDLAQRSPGQVLLRQVLLAAIDEGAATFDFGIGEQAYKYRFASEAPMVRTWELYARPRRGASGSSVGNDG